MKSMIRLTAGFILLQTLSGVSQAASDPLESWFWRNPLPQGSPLYGVTHGNDTYVAVAPNGTVVTSYDGYNWVSQTPGAGTNAALYAVTYGNGLFVAVGPDGSILTSPDGKSWTDRTLNPFHHLNTVTYGSHRFVALGQKILESDVNIVTSEDGVTWMAGTIAATKPLTGVIFGDGLFVAVGSDSWGNGNIATSPDGVNWTTRDTVGLTSVAHGNGRFVAVGGTNVLISTNGSDWIAQTVPGVRSAITFGNGLFVATDGSYEAKVHVSSDGVAWETHAFPSVEFAQGITYGGDQFVAVGLWGTILASTNAIDWTLRIRRAGPGKDLSGIATDGSRLVVVQAGGGTLVSTNGIDWSYHSVPGLSNQYYSLQGITYGAGRFVAVGGVNPYNPSARRVVIDYSADGDSWTHEELPESGVLRAVAFGIGQFVAVGESIPSLLLTSPDGINWTRRTVLEAPDVLNSVAFAQERFVVVGKGGRILTSSDGIEWRKVSQFDPPQDLNGVAYGNRLFVAAGKYCVAISPDGVNWQTSSFSGPATNDFSGIDFVAGVFMAKTLRGTMISENGSEWTLRRWIQYYGSGRVVETMGTLISVGYGGGILQSASLSALPRFSSPRISGDGSCQLTITGRPPQSLRVEISRDLSNWQPLTTLALTNSAQVFHDPAPDPERRFYRAFPTP